MTKTHGATKINSMTFIILCSSWLKLRVLHDSTQLATNRARRGEQTEAKHDQSTRLWSRQGLNSLRVALVSQKPNCKIVAREQHFAETLLEASLGRLCNTTLKHWHGGRSRHWKIEMRLHETANRKGKSVAMKSAGNPLWAGIVPLRRPYLTSTTLPS